MTNKVNQKIAIILLKKKLRPKILNHLQMIISQINNRIQGQIIPKAIIEVPETKSIL